MKIKLFFTIALLVIFTTSCSNKSEISIDKIQGYWEIKEVEMADGSKKEYVVNPIVDHYSLKDSVGERQKLQPQLDGTYQIVSGKENFKIKHFDGNLVLFYKSDYSEWQEQIIELSDSVFIVKNLDQIKYTYKRSVPFSLK